MPVALAEANRIIKFYNTTHLPKHDANTKIFNFSSFFETDRTTWVNKIHRTAIKVGIDIDISAVDSWFLHFKKYKSQLIEKRELISRCVEDKKFLSKNLTENEKGIILGYRAIKDSVFDEDFIQTSYFHHMIY